MSFDLKKIVLLSLAVVAIALVLAFCVGCGTGTVIKLPEEGGVVILPPSEIVVVEPVK